MGKQACDELVGTRDTDGDGISVVYAVIFYQALYFEEPSLILRTNIYSESQGTSKWSRDVSLYSGNHL